MLTRSTADRPYEAESNAPAASIDNANPWELRRVFQYTCARDRLLGASISNLSDVEVAQSTMEKERRVLLASFVLWQHAKHRPSR
jgi:hypothetical protein